MEMTEGHGQGVMNSGFDSTDRRPADYVLFALGFVSFMVAVGGIIVSSPPIAGCGAAVLVLLLWSFRDRLGPG